MIIFVCMKVLVINGSPKGSDSVTLQTCLYLEKKFPEHRFSYLSAARKIKALEQDFSPALELLREADLLLFSYPVYTFLVPCQLHRFIELMKASGEDFSAKAATQLSTSKHFYDITAHRFIEDNCADLGLRYVDGLSADMEDILTEEGRRQAADWWAFVQWRLERGDFKQPGKARFSGVPYAPGAVSVPAAGEKKAGRTVALVTDARPEDGQLRAMTERFQAVFPYEVQVVNLWDFPFKGGCQGCFNCAATGKCVYSDGFDRFLRETVQSHDAVVYAFRVQDHSMGSRFKMYDDRQFCNGHRTVTMGSPVGYLVAGPYSAEENLRVLLEARAQVGGNFLAGVATDETDPDRQVDSLSETMAYALENGYSSPRNFYGVGGMKIFRDLIWQMRGLMRADHRFFKSHGQYDFPQKKWRTSLLMYLVGWMMSSKKMKAKAGGKMTEGMLAPYKKMLEKVK